jgi:signal transduction histidine kinase
VIGRRVPPLAVSVLIAAVGALATLAIGLGPFGPDEVGHLALLMMVAIALTALATAVMAPRLARASFSVRLVSIAAFATMVGFANLTVLSLLMLVDAHVATVIAVLLIYSTAAAVGAALATARATSDALARVDETARRLAAGDLEARTGPVGEGGEIESLARALDEMADRLGSSLAREREAEAQRRNLVTAVSHDLRTPLAGLRAMVEAIEDGVVNDPSTIRRYLREMTSSVDSLVGLVDDLFELVQLDAGAIQAETERARVEEVVGSALAACKAQAASKGLVVQAHIDGAAQVPCSPRLTRVVQNLLQNAIRHTPSDGTVIIEASHRECELELSVLDNGDGIDAAVLDRVFEPFWRGDSARRGEGSGLGLALAKRIVEALGGRIAVESSSTRGSRFAVLVPDGGDADRSGLAP